MPRETEASGESGCTAAGYQRIGSRQDARPAAGEGTGVREMKTRVLLGFLLVALAAPVHAQVDTTISVEMPAEDSQLVIERAGFDAALGQPAPTGSAADLAYGRPDGSADLWIAMRPAVEGQAIATVRQERWNEIDAGPLSRTAVRRWEEGQVALLEYLEDGAAGRGRDKHVLAFIPRGETIVEVHAVARDFEPGGSGQETLARIFGSMRILPRSPG